MQLALRDLSHPWQAPPPLPQPGHPPRPVLSESTSHLAFENGQSSWASQAEEDGDLLPPSFHDMGEHGGLDVSLGTLDGTPFAPQCSSCGASFAGGVRYLCSHCPVEATGGFNLCSACEPFSLLVHNPSHVFLKINRSYSMSSIRPVPPFPLLYSNEVKIPELDSPAAERVWDMLLSTSGATTIDARRVLDPLVQALPAGHPLRAKVPRVLTLRVQLHHARTAAGLDVVPPNLKLPDAEPEGSETGTETPTHAAASTCPSYSIPTSTSPPNSTSTFTSSFARSSRRGSVASSATSLRPVSISTPTPEEALEEVVQALLMELSLVPINQLVHPYILCDSCFDVVEGPWLRCANCTDSVDVCGECELRADHDPSHVFAVFKQSVDNGLFKSLVDLAPMGNALGRSNGSCRPILPSVLFH